MKNFQVSLKVDKTFHAEDILTYVNKDLRN